ncbi:hypothetical protein [Pontibacter rugosus]
MKHPRKAASVRGRAALGRQVRFLVYKEQHPALGGKGILHYQGSDFTLRRVFLPGQESGIFPKQSGEKAGAMGTV